MIMKYKNILLLMIMAMISIASAQDTEYEGGYAGSFLRMGLGARNLALGNSGVALHNSTADFYYNPALVGYNEDKSFTTGYTFLTLDRKFNYLGFTLPLPPSAAISVNWIHTGVDDIQGRDFTGYPDEKYTTGEDALMLTFGNKMSEKLAFGFSFKYVRHSLLDITGSGLGFDAGVMVQVIDGLTLGFQAKDLTAAYNWKTTEIFDEEGGNYIERFPIVIKSGLAYQYKNFIFVGDIVNFEGDNFFHYGMEYNYEEIASFRIGHDGKGLTMGLGLQYEFMWNTKTQLDYAFVQERYGEGHSHVFTWNFKI